MKKILLSVCIPTYEMRGEATRVLTRSFNILKQQTLKRFEIVISDNSTDDVIKNLCKRPEYASLNINYFKNPIKGMAQNTNSAIRHARGEIIKILYMDDYLADKNSLQEIVYNFKGHWMVTGCEHDDENHRYNSHYPTYNNKIHSGKNTIGSPSVLAIKNENPLLFDENMTWLLDCDYYKRLYDKYGKPTILNQINVVIGISKYQVTNILPSSAKKKERYYMARKYNKRLLYWLGLW
jgi:glycosyltransferase involved in cell wall biosynthesis